MVSRIVFLASSAFLVGILAIPTEDIYTPEDNDLEVYYHADSQSRIVGGSVAADGSSPYMAALINGWLIRSLVCGGSLISERHVLTAAHCVSALYKSGSLSRTLRVRVGSNRWSRGGLLYRVASNVTHSEYSSSAIKNDIGLLITSSKVVLSTRVKPLPLTFDFVGAGVEARVTGWGRTRRNGPISASLLELEVKTIDGQQCLKGVADLAASLNVTMPPVNPTVELCVYHSPGRGMCNGDSGSALVLQNSTEQAGIVSWGFPCARGAPDMFVRISAYQQWLNQSISL